MNEAQKKYLEEFIKNNKVVERQEDWGDYESINVHLLERFIIKIISIK